MPAYSKVSVHGGHSAEYCGHAKDTLEQVVSAYIEQGFEWVCLTEHMPTKNASLIGPEEQQQKFTVDELHIRFDKYFAEARRLAHLYHDKIDILVGFETEAYSGYQAEIDELISHHKPDMLVGSVHHVEDILFDASAEEYQRAVDKCGGIENLYCQYFDKQLELINRFRPQVVGHFDLVRIYDPEYNKRWDVPSIQQRALRNLERINELGLILDYNFRALVKGASEPYLSAPWLARAIELGIAITPGDDSHGCDSVGGEYARGVDFLLAAGGTDQWQKPALCTYTHHS